jgi:protein PhnA
MVLLTWVSQGKTMTLTALQARSSQCELCGSDEGLTAFVIPPAGRKGADGAVLTCAHCHHALSAQDLSDTHHWHCLHESIWSEHAPVKVLSYRILHKLRAETWAQDLLEQVLLESDDLAWAQQGLENDATHEIGSPTVDGNGATLQEGDSVTLIKDLDVKGGGFTAKRGTLVKGIRLTENPAHVEGRVNGILIVLVAKFLKKV